MVIKPVMPDTDLQLDTRLNAPSARSLLLERWRVHVNELLPSMAKANGWPISQNHCFMRVCLDTSLGVPWHNVVKRPASRHMTDEQLRAAIAVAEQIVENPSLLVQLNHSSIMRRIDPRTD
jgi:hypothetical protein